jgi:outer membrane receptor protein involved in Fe transport
MNPIAARLCWLVGLGGAALPALLPSTARAVGEQNAHLRGTVVVRDGGVDVPMPGARVQLKSEALIGGPRTLTSDEEGRFDFPPIPPGSYELLITYEGLVPTKRRIVLELGQTVDLKIPLTAELTQTETTVIVEERKRLDADRVSTGKVLTAEQQAKLATPRRYQDVVQQVAGVTGGSNPVMAGGSLRHNRYLVDGLDITDPVEGTFSANFNFDAIGQMDLLLLAVDAQYNSLGGVINLVTKRGSDRLTVDSSFYVNHQALSVGARAGSQLYEGRLVDQSDPGPPTASYQVNLNIGGPLIKQKLWFYFSTEYRYRINSVVPGPPLNIQHPPLERHDLYTRLKLTFAPTARHRIDLSLNGDPAFLTNIRNIDGSPTNAYAPEAEYYQNQGGAFGILNWDWFVTDHVIWNVQAGLQWFGFGNGPQLGDLTSSAHNDNDSTIGWNNADTGLIVSDGRLRFQLDPTLTISKKGWLGQHTFKMGAQLQVLRQYALVGTPGNSVYTDNTNQPGDGGVLLRDRTSMERPLGCVELAPQPRMGSSATPCFQRILYEPPRAQVRIGWALGFFVQDTWKPVPWLTLVPGLRVDYGTAENSRGEVVQNLLGFGPRIGLSIDLLRDGKTLLKFAYGRSNEVASLRAATFADATPRAWTFGYSRATGRFDQFVTAEGGAAGYDLRGRCPDGTVTLACGNAKLSLRPPHADFVTAALERELGPNVIGGVTYTYRLIEDQWEDIELNARRTLDGGAISGFGDPSSGSIKAYRPVTDARRRYQAVDFAITGTPSPSWQLFVAYTLSFLDGTLDDQLSTFRNDPPRDFRFFGYLQDDHRHQLKANASYTFRGLSAGVNLAYVSGAPTTRLYLTQLGYIGRYAWRGVDPGTDPNDVRRWSELRSPDVVDVTLRAQYDFFGLVRQHLSLIVDLFNAFDLSTATRNSTTGAPTYQPAFEARNSASYATALGRQTPFRVQFGLRYQY